MADDSGKVLNDCIHGHIQLSDRLMKIVDTPEVQRLRDLKQLGMASFVYPGATHTRFAHSIGVCHLAGVFLRELINRQKEELKDITEDDIFCVQVAGLCHDLGHGPFSHMFEKVVKSTYKENWKHEQASLEMFMHMLENARANKGINLVKEADINFIRELIYSKDKSKRKGRGPGKEFLYEIISNEETGIDVDKFDYFARDCHALGLSYMFDHKRYMKMSRVVKFQNGERHICCRDKEVDSLIILFQTRFTLHFSAYQHPVVCALDQMVCDALKLVEGDLQTEGNDKQMFSLTHCIKDMDAYIKLDDSVLSLVRNFVLPPDADSGLQQRVQKAKDIVARVSKRKLYKMVWHCKNLPGVDLETKSSVDLEEQIWIAGQQKFHRENIYVQIAIIDFGKKDNNPLKDLWLYSKSEPSVPKTYNDEMASQLLLPRTFQEKIVRVYSKADSMDECKSIGTAAQLWEKMMRETPSS